MRTARLFVIASMTLVGTTRIHAQPEPPRDHREHEHERRVPPPGGAECPKQECGPRLGMPTHKCPDGSVAGPTDRCLRHPDGKCGWEVLQCANAAARPMEPPPPAREENMPPRPGFVFLGGHWDWRDGKWAWVAGRYEKERAGKKWRPHRWELRDKQYVLVEGEWIEEAGAPGGVVVLGPIEPPPPPREEKMPPRPGFVYVPGRWDWRDKKWAWVAGRYERERPGKKWRPHRWELRDKQYVLVEGDWIDEGAVGVVIVGPAEPPPPPREERMPPRPGFVFIPGHWDWRDGKWTWAAGRFEQERPGKKWRPHRWELRGNQYALVEGDWIDEGAAVVIEPPPGERRHWRLDRPFVSSYWPLKGKVGGRVVIRGRNFPPDAMVVWNNEPVKGARVTPEEIVVVVPPGAASGDLAIRRANGRDLYVGPFEVRADFDADAEARRLEQERQRRAEEAWVARQKELAKDRAAREAAFRQREDERAANREQRRAERVAAIRAKWARQAFLADPDTQSELTIHAQRLAKLERLREVAEIDSNGKVVIRIDVATNRENDRHEQRMAALEAGFKAKGGAP